MQSLQWWVSSCLTLDVCSFFGFLDLISVPSLPLTPMERSMHFQGMSHLILIQISKVGKTNFILLPFCLLPRGSPIHPSMQLQNPIHPSHSCWRNFELRNFGLTAAQSWMEKGRHCGHFRWETNFHGLALGTFWIPRTCTPYQYHAQCLQVTLLQDGKGCSDLTSLEPWACLRSTVPLRLEKAGATRHHCQNVPYFPCCAEKAQPIVSPPP